MFKKERYIRFYNLSKNADNEKVYYGTKVLFIPIFLIFLVILVVAGMLVAKITKIYSDVTEDNGSIKRKC